MTVKVLPYRSKLVRILYNRQKYIKKLTNIRGWSSHLPQISSAYILSSLRSIQEMKSSKIVLGIFHSI